MVLGLKPMGKLITFDKYLIGEGGPLFLLIAECPAIRVRSELCRTKSLMQSTSATVPG